MRPSGSSPLHGRSVHDGTRRDSGGPARDRREDRGPRTEDGTLTPQDVVDELRRRGSNYEPSTIRTHIVSRMCANAPTIMHAPTTTLKGLLAAAIDSDDLALDSVGTRSSMTARPTGACHGRL